MANKADPVLRVLEYFQTVPLPAATQALALVRRLVSDRVSTEQEAAQAAGNKISRKRRARRTKAQMQAAKEEKAAKVAAGSAVSLRPPAKPGKAGAKAVAETQAAV